MIKKFYQLLLVLSVILVPLALTSSANASTKVTICHAGSAYANPYQSTPVDFNSIDANGHSGHTGPVFDPSTMQQGDTWGDIIPPLETFPGLNWPAGKAILENGCVVPTTTDICENVDGTQETLPLGYVETNQDKVCACATGYEASYEEDESLVCTLIEEPTDVCPNIKGDQKEIPEGLIRDESGNCVETNNEKDLCPNKDGIQLTVPNHYFIDDQGNCSRMADRKKKVAIEPEVLGTSTAISEPEELPVGGGDGLSVIMSLGFALIFIASSAIVFETTKIFPHFMNEKK